MSTKTVAYTSKGYSRFLGTVSICGQLSFTYFLVFKSWCFPRWNPPLQKNGLCSLVLNVDFAFSCTWHVCRL